MVEVEPEVAAVFRTGPQWVGIGLLRRA